MNSLIRFAYSGYIDLFYRLLQTFREDRLHFLLRLLYGRHLFRTFHLISKGFEECPLDGKCLQQNVVYQATITTDAATESYVGLATNSKERYRNHQTSFRHTNRRNETELSKHISRLNLYIYIY